KCAGLRRNFARLEEGAEENGGAGVGSVASSPARTYGFIFAALDEQPIEGAGLQVEVQGKEYALFRIDGKVHALDSACPNEGAPLAQGEVAAGVITCPWHGWTFNACSGCSIDPAGSDVRSYAVKS